MTAINAVIFDWQGTLVDVSGIRHLVENTTKRNFPEFHLRTGTCPPIESTVQGAWSALDDGRRVIVMTGCSDDFRDVAMDWMIRNDVPHHALLMRRAGDFRKDVEVKREMLNHLRRIGITVRHAWDDNPNIVELWRSEDISTTVVPGWTAS